MGPVVRPDEVVTTTGPHHLEAGQEIVINGAVVKRVSHVLSATSFLLVDPPVAHVLGCGGVLADLVGDVIVNAAWALITRDDEIGRIARRVVFEWIQKTGGEHGE